MPTNALYGFTTMLLRVLRDYAPDEVVMTFDMKAPTFRKELYPEYKANRESPPEELVPQFPYFPKIVEAFNIPVLQMEGWEADDLIATVTRIGLNEGREVTVVTGDKDLMQVVRPGVTLLDTMKDRRIGREEVVDYFGVPPEQVLDLQALMGDSSDNIPGVKGIGKKKGAALIEKYGSLEQVLEHADEIGGKTGATIAESRDIALLSRELAHIRDDVPLSTHCDDWVLEEPDPEKLTGLFTELEFTSLLQQLAPSKALDRGRYRCITSKDDFAALMDTLSSVERLAVDTETTSPKPMEADLVGISLAWAESEAVYIPLAHDADVAPEQLDRQWVLDQLRPILEEDGVGLYGQNIKYDMTVLERHGVSLRNVVCDCMLVSYLLKPSRRSHGLDAIAQDLLGHTMIKFEDVAGKGKKQKTFNQIGLDVAAEYAAEDADVTFQVAEILLAALADEPALQSLYEDMELPVMHVLFDMEKNGIRADASVLNRMSGEFEVRIADLESAIHEVAGGPFKISSPKQLQVVLYETLGLPTGKKTKTGFSTNEAELTRLALIHPIAEQILQYRQLTKLKSTYVDSLPEQINPVTGRIHTSYSQTRAATGRLASTDPNLQNIPIRTEEGRLIRSAFIPDPGHQFVGADYSQIELRVLAHLSEDKVLTSAFNEDEDVHTRTAAEVFGVDPSEVTSDQRREAKVINFGIIYGMSSYGLSAQLKISPGVAQDYIDAYFERYAGVYAFIEETLDGARETGEVETLFGRKRWIGDMPISENNFSGPGARIAINTPIQGTAADLMKMAMINVWNRLQADLPDVRLLLQIHDELILEVPDAQVDAASALLREEMENVYALSVPLKVDVSTGSTWADLK
jgi:DNA polymerase-1